MENEVKFNEDTFKELVWQLKNDAMTAGHPLGTTGAMDESQAELINYVIAAWNARAGTPAIDTAEVERLVDAVGKAAVKNNKAFESAEEMHEWLNDIGAIFSAYDALAAVRKGGKHE